MRYETLTVDTDPRGVVRLTLNRADKRNAMSGRMIDELTGFARTTGASRDTRAVVLAAAGPVFCAGGDLDWMMDQIRADRPTRMREARKLAEMLGALNTMPAPLIAAVHGNAFGGGVGLMCVCDAVIAVEGARFALTETRLGLIPATIGPYVIARLGEGRARRVFMSGKMFDATQAQSMGLVSAVSAADGLEAAVAAEVEPYLGVSSEAVGAAKSLARFLGPVIDDAVIDATITRLADTWETDDALEGIDAFLSKRKPRWSSGG